MITALVPALVSAFIALITIIITKEQKVSEFRQAWINALRDDLAEAISAASTLSVILQWSTGDEQKNDKHKEWARFTAALARIELRLNMSEAPHRKLEQCIRKAELLVRELELVPEEYSSHDWEQLQDDVIAVSQPLLKIEWNRVKDGEPVYRYTIVALIMTVAGTLLAALVNYVCAHN